jgi:photosystem II stability/assembly factor-like uncharacterized protein
MKSYLLTLFFFLLIAQMNYPQWTNQNPVPDGNDLWSTFFIDDSTGWIVGSAGFIKKTTNAGNEWIEQNSGTTLILKAVQFVDQNTGWICGESGLILKTNDGGVSWDSLASGTTQHLTDIHFYDADTGYVVGFNGTLLKTTNGGANWTSLSSGATIDLYAIDFVDAFIGYAVGGGNANRTFLKTTDGGTSWMDKSSGFPSIVGPCLAVKFIDANTGCIGGGLIYSKFIYKTTDGGENWVASSFINPPLEKKERISGEQLSPYDYYNYVGINSIYFKDSNKGYATAGDYNSYYREIFRTTDGGSTWIYNFSFHGDESGLVSVHVTSSGMGWVVGFKGVIFISEDDGNSWRQILSGKKFSCAGDDLYTVFCIDENIGWTGGYRKDCTCGYGHIVLKTTNGGKIWKTQLLSSSSCNKISSLYFINENTGWAVNDVLHDFYRTTDSGENWTNVSNITGSSVFFINQDTGWLTKVNYIAGIYKSTDGGITWTQKSSISSSSVFFSDINNGWAAGAGGNILKSTDGGETWLTKTSGTINDLKFVRFYNSNIGMCVGNAGTVLLSTDGGENWIEQNVSTSENLTAVEFINTTTIWIVGSNGTILNTTNLGYNWTSFDSVTTNDLTSLSFVNEYTGWVAGLNGTMFKYSVEPPPPPAPPVWSNQITVKDAGSTESSNVLTFGQHIDATDSIDASLGEYEVPPPPPTGIFDARFNLPTNPQVSSLSDYRDSAKTEIIWTMTFQPGSSGYPMTFSWDSTRFPEGTFYLKDRINGSFVNVNMKSQSSYVLSQIAIASLAIIFNRYGINPTAPNSPSNLIAVSDTFSVTLNWVDNSDNEVGFVIERRDGDSTSAIQFVKIDTVLANVNAYSDNGLIPNTTYTYRVFAFNEYFTSNYSNLFQITTISLPATFQLTVSILDAWNMVSVPGINPNGMGVGNWWFNHIGTVWGFNGAQYVETATTTPGEGYWMKNEGVEIYNYPVIQIVAHDSIEATSGWNMIGGYETSVAVANITTNPPNQLTGNIWGFNGVQYLPVLTLVPGYGYWVRVVADCEIIIPDAIPKDSGVLAELFKEGWGRIILTDALGKSYTLYAVKGDSPNGGASVDLSQYELPPLPPAGAFDIRFSSGRIAEDINSSVKTIDMSGVTYPLTIRVEGMDIRLMDETGKLINLNLKKGEDVVISDGTIEKLMVTGELIPDKYSMEQNYPNPFNPNTVIEFSLPENVSNVKLTIYSILGEKVAELVNTSLVAGKYSYTWNANNVATGMSARGGYASGVYIYELRTDKYLSIKKMVLMK